jgi:hypothetical protein
MAGVSSRLDEPGAALSMNFPALPLPVVSVT